MRYVNIMLWNSNNFFFTNAKYILWRHVVFFVQRGILKSDEDEYYAISPLPERFHGPDETPHVIVRLENAVKLKRSLGKFVAASEQHDDGLPRARARRATWPPAALNLEIAIFVDQDLYRLMAVNFESNTEKEIIRFVLAMVNAVRYSR